MGVKNIYILSDTKVEGAITLPLIQQKFFPCDKNIFQYDYLIFTSKNGVKAADKIDSSWRTIPAISIGKATSKMIREMGGKVALESDIGYGEALAQKIVEQIQTDAKLLHIRPKKVVTSIKDLLEPHKYNIDECIAYETLCSGCKELERPPKNSVIIFTSPSTVYCFFRCFDWDESYQAIAIGKKTAKALPTYVEAKIPPLPSISSCILISKNIV